MNNFQERRYVPYATHMAMSRGSVQVTTLGEARPLACDMATMLQVYYCSKSNLEESKNFQQA